MLGIRIIIIRMLVTRIHTHTTELQAKLMVMSRLTTIRHRRAIKMIVRYVGTYL